MFEACPGFAQSQVSSDAFNDDFMFLYKLAMQTLAHSNKSQVHFGHGSPCFSGQLLRYSWLQKWLVSSLNRTEKP